jgi:predicted porin
MNKLLTWTTVLVMQVSNCVAQDATTKHPSDEIHKPFAVASVSDLEHAFLDSAVRSDADASPEPAQIQEKKPKEQYPQGDTQTSPAVAQSPGSAGTGASLSRPAGNRPGTLEGAGKLTYKGITFYGNIDVGAQYQTHGATYNDDAPQTGLQQVVVKNSNHALIHYSQNGMSQSILGVRGDFNLGHDISLLFKLEPGIEPMDGFRWTNSVKSLAENDGVAIQNQTANFDTNRGGRIDNGEAFFGFEKMVSDDKFVTLTFGRVVSVVSDKVSKYDFNSGSYAFSLISYQGIVSGGGDSEDLRLDSALKFTSQLGRYRISGLTQFSGKNPVFQPDSVYGSNRQLDLGYDWSRLSADVVYVGVRDGISATYLSAAQAATLPKGSLAATISDNTSYAVMSRYKVSKSGRLRAFGGLNHIRYRNPLISLKTGITTIGGFELSVLTQNAYTVNKILMASWLGMQYSITPKLNVSGGWYQFHQNSYAGNGCSDNSASQCSGALNVMPILFAYSLNRSIDLYGGSEGSFVTAGYSNGYLHTTDVTVAVGGRYHF